jgi:tryptophan synthase alpha chain
VTAIAEVFRRLSSKREGAYIPYVCCGDNGTEFTLKLMRTLEEAGADIIELGLPFSDPLADGPTIQAAMMRSLDSGFKVARIFDTVKEARDDGISAPIILMTYYNPIVRIGVDEFCSRLSRAGGDALLPVDLPVEESRDLDVAAANYSLDVVRLIAPSTGDERADRILESTTGFAYAVSVSGVTGARHELPESAFSLLKRLRGRTSVPIALGFGISSTKHVKEALTAGASGIVEGSALINLYSARSDGQSKALQAIETHARMMKAATRNAIP